MLSVPPSRLQQICAAFPQQRLVVLGDLMLDHLIVGDARRISPEAPIPVVNFLHETYTPGGAANVAHNLVSLGARVDLLGVVGNDSAATLLRESLSQHAIGTDGLIAEPGRATTLKTRITAQRQQLVRLDRETSEPARAATAEKLLSHLRAVLPGAAAVLVADYAKGVVSQPLLDATFSEAARLGVPVCIDPKPAHQLEMRGCALLTPNRKETFELAGMSESANANFRDRDDALQRAVAAVQARHDPAVLLVTLSEAGLLLAEKGHVPQPIPTFARQVFDVTGAGDTVIAAFALARAAGATPFEAATLANHAAGIVVGKPGTASVTTAELLEWVRVHPDRR